MGGTDVGKSTGLLLYIDHTPPPAGAAEGDVYKVDVGAIDLGKSLNIEALPSPKAQLPLLVGEASVTLRVFVDHTFAEAYWQDGRVAMIVPAKVSPEAAIAVQVGSRSAAEPQAGTHVVVQSADVWEVNSIWVPPEEVLRTPRRDETLLV